MTQDGSKAAEKEDDPVALKAAFDNGYSEGWQARGEQIAARLRALAKDLDCLVGFEQSAQGLRSLAAEIGGK